MEIQKWIKEFQEIFDGQPWYGTSLMETLHSISFQNSNFKLNSKSHSIAELVQHMLNWRIFVIEKLNGNEEFDIALNSLQDWPISLSIKDEVQWNNLIYELIQSQAKIVEALLNKSEDWLYQKTPSKDYNNEFLIRGIIYHDVYHLGQIRLLKSVINSLEGI